MRSYQNFEFPYPLIAQEAPDDLNVIVVIPAYTEPDIDKTLNSLINNSDFLGSTEVIIVLNESENTPAGISEFHRSQLNHLQGWAKVNSTSRLKFYPVLRDKINVKQAGVGIARKTGMDEAYKRFRSIGNLNGIIACLDADTLTAVNYLKELSKESSASNNIKAYSIYFEHDMKNTPGESNQLAIIDYELHLRYYINMQRWLGFPFAYYTIGSAMAVRTYAYGEAFGMNKRKAGEDFYFLHKFIKTGYFKEINSTKVFPSARLSDRVPFGTGRALSQKISAQSESLTYNYMSFEELRSMTENLDLAFFDNAKFIEKLTSPVQEFLNRYCLEKKLTEIKDNTKSPGMFKKRFYAWFDAFKMMKYMHFCRDNYFPDITVSEAVNHLVEKLKMEHGKSKREYLDLLRHKDLEGEFNV